MGPVETAAAPGVVRSSPPRPRVPAPRPFTCAEYYRLAEAGILGPDERVELLDGVVIAMPAMGGRHASCIGRLSEAFVAGVGQRGLVRIQLPLRLDDASEPEPDLAVVLRQGPTAYLSRHPGPAESLLVIEAGDSSATFDREDKAPRYARAGISELWLIDLEADLVRVLLRPVLGEWSEARVLRRGDTVSPTAFADLRLEVTDLLGPPG